MMHGAPGGLGGVNGDADFVERRLGLDDDGIRAGFNQRPGLFLVSGSRLLLRQVAVRLQNRAERAEVAEHEAFARRQTPRARCGRPPG